VSVGEVFENPDDQTRSVAEKEQYRDQEHIAGGFSSLRHVNVIWSALVRLNLHL
jgi:hypothetical protein